MFEECPPVLTILGVFWISFFFLCNFVMLNLFTAVMLENFAGMVATLRMQLQPGTCPFPVPRFGGKITMPNAGIMAYPSTTRI